MISGFIAAETYMCVKQTDGSVVKYEVDSVTQVRLGTREVFVYIDLGLPSGTLWANRNLGAENVNEVGGYYSWGETSTKEYYEWNTYKWSDGDYRKMSKYCQGIDDKYVIEPDDDAVTVERGAGCQIPTIEQWNELKQYCECTWMEYKGVYGCRFMAKNASWIFLPVSGMKYMDHISGEDCTYWSSSRNLSDSDNDALGYMMSQHSYIEDEANVSTISVRRYYGCQIRPVKVKK